VKLADLGGIFSKRLYMLFIMNFLSILLSIAIPFHLVFFSISLSPQRLLATGRFVDIK
jgi:hypothetical protein